MAQPTSLPSQALENRSERANEALAASNAAEFVKPKDDAPPPPPAPDNILLNDNINTLVGTAGEIDYFVFDLSASSSSGVTPGTEQGVIQGFETGVDKIVLINAVVDTGGLLTRIDDSTSRYIFLGGSDGDQMAQRAVIDVSPFVGFRDVLILTDGGDYLFG